MYKITYLTRRGNMQFVCSAVVSLARLEEMRKDGRYSVITADKVRSQS